MALEKLASKTDDEKIKDRKIIVRSRKDGDRIFLKNLGHKKVKKILIDEKIMKWERDSVPIVEIEIDGQKISTYEKLQELFDAAVEKDLQGNKFDNTVNLKWKVYKQLLQKSDGFTGDLFTK